MFGPLEHRLQFASVVVFHGHVTARYIAPESTWLNPTRRATRREIVLLPLADGPSTAMTVAFVVIGFSLRTRRFPLRIALQFPGPT
jgi:hypothetical protein